MPGEVRLTLITCGSQGPRRYAFTAPATCTPGRSDDCEVVVPASPLHADVSRRHCELRIDPPRVLVRDLGSLNGTFVNGARVGQPVPLGDGDELRLGRGAACLVEIDDVTAVLRGPHASGVRGREGPR
jgi:pSer/pThr/pTyr-binding forkhead associated (FHA) protein